MKHGARDTLEQDWYEIGLPSTERKQRGHFSTPHALVDQILDACGYTASADLRSLRLLDPACGSGNFLTRAAWRLCQALDARGLSQAERDAYVQRNLWGLDPDPVACFLAEMQVRSALTATRGTRACGPTLHIHQADSLALAWQPCVDLLLANPPYLATKNTDLSHYPQVSRRGQGDSYLLFLELALSVVRPGGWIGLVLPDPVLARANAAPERTKLLRECTIQYIWHLADVFAAEVGAVVIIAQKTPPRPLHRVCWTRARWSAERVLCGPEQISSRVGQALLARQPGAELRYLLSLEQGRASERLRRALNAASTGPARLARLLPLDALVEIKRGEEIGRNSGLLGPLTALKNGLPVLRGGIDLRPYAICSADLGIERVALKKPLERYLRPKLLVVKSTERLQAALDTGGHVVLQTLYLLHLRSLTRSRDAENTHPLAGLGAPASSPLESRGAENTHPLIESGAPASSPLESRDAENSSPLAESGASPTSPIESRGAGDSSPLTGFGVSPTSPFFEEVGGDEIMTTYYFLLALLNSRLLSAYVYHLHTAYKLVQPQIEQAVLAHLPIAWGNASERREIAERASVLAQACARAGAVVEWDTHLIALYEEQEHAVCALYAAATSAVFADKGVALDG